MVIRRGPDTEPWGTPWVTDTGVELYPMIVVNYFLLKRYNLNQERAAPMRPGDSDKQSRKIVWEIVSKAAERSRRGMGEISADIIILIYKV